MSAGVFSLVAHSQQSQGKFESNKTEHGYGGGNPSVGTFIADVSLDILFLRSLQMAKKQTAAQKEVGNAIRKTKKGTQESGKGGKAKSRKQAIAIGLSKARKKGEKVPKKKSG